MIQTISGWRFARTPLLSLTAAVTALLLATTPVLAAVGWTSPVGSGRAYSWNYGFGLARTVSGTTGYLHTQMGTDYVSGTWVDDDGPAHLGVYYRRGTGSGQTWGTSKRMNPTGQHAYQGAIAAAGSHVYVAWSSVEHIGNAFDPADPRALWFRANDLHGSSTHWSAATAITTEGRIDHPTIAATGARVYVAHTNADTGDIVLWTSTDHGATFESRTVGTTTRTNGDNGFAGWPIVVASGSLVAVGWLSNDEAMVILSTDDGAAFSAPEGVGVNPARTMGMAAKGDRVAVAVTSEASSWMRVWKAGTWKPISRFAGHDPSGTGTYRAAYGPAVALAGTSTVGVSWSACRRASCAGSSSYGVDVRYRESADNGATFKSPQTIASYATSTSRRINDFPSLLMTSTSRRVITYNTASASYSTYRVLVEVGKGTP
jgi:hypothetical protein